MNGRVPGAKPHNRSLAEMSPSPRLVRRTGFLAPACGWCVLAGPFLGFLARAIRSARNSARSCSGLLPLALALAERFELPLLRFDDPVGDVGRCDEHDDVMHDARVARQALRRLHPLVLFEAGVGDVEAIRLDALRP